LTRWKIGAGVALAAGVALTIVMAVHVGLGGLLRAVHAVGWSGFAAYALVSAAVFAPLGLAWWTAAPDAPASQAWAFIWGRLLREAASDVLPLAQVGGLLVGVRAVSARGVGEAQVVGSLIIDLTTEMAAQLVYTLFGVALLTAALAHATGAREIAATAGWAALLGGGVLAAFIVFQGRSVDLAARLSSRWLKNTRARADAVRAVLTCVYAQPLRLASGFGLHSFSWVASGACAWLALRFMGVDLPLWRVLMLESLMAAVRSVAFMTPGALGVQEGAYVLVAPMLGLPPDSALALALIRRGKDLAIGVPALLLWQTGEGRRILVKPDAPRGSATKSAGASDGPAQGLGRPGLGVRRSQDFERPHPGGVVEDLSGGHHLVGLGSPDESL
jgi:putative membrane protein